MKKYVFTIIFCSILLLSGCGRKTETPVIPAEPAAEVVEDVTEEAAEGDFEEPVTVAEPQSTENLAAFIVDFYTRKFVPEGEYVIFDTETEESEDAIRFIVRYRPSEQEEEEMIASGKGPIANIYVTTVTYTRATNALMDENGLDLNEG